IKEVSHDMLVQGVVLTLILGASKGLPTCTPASYMEDHPCMTKYAWVSGEQGAFMTCFSSPDLSLEFLERKITTRHISAFVNTVFSGLYRIIRLLGQDMYR